MTSSPSLQSSHVPRIKLRSPADLVAITPYLLGFHPTESVIVTAFRDHRVVFAARSDLPGPQTPPAAELAANLIEVSAQQHPDGLAILGYGAAANVDGLVRAVRAAAEQRELIVNDVLRVEDGRWWSYLCDNPQCCPPEGTPFDLSASEVSAHCILEGLAAAPNRQEYARVVAPVGGVTRISMSQATDRAEQELQQWLASRPEQQWQAAVTDRGTAAVDAAITRYAAGGRLDDDELAMLSLLLVSIPVRDAAWRAIMASEPHRTLWTDATQRVAPELVAAPASLLGFTAWRAGEAVLARLALERALSEDPTYSMANLLLAGVQRGVPPSALDDWGSPQWAARLDKDPPAGQPLSRSRRARARARARRARRERGG